MIEPVRLCVFQYNVVTHKAEEPLFSRVSDSSESEVRLVRPGVKTDKRWCLCVGLAILFVGIFTAAGIYFGCEFHIKFSCGFGRFRLFLCGTYND